MSYFHISIILNSKGTLMVIETNEPGKYRGMASCHSECNALKTLNGLIKRRRINPKVLKKGLTMVNLALTYTGTVRMSKPCAHCSEILGESLIKQVYWTTKDGTYDVRYSRELIIDACISSGHR